MEVIVPDQVSDLRQTVVRREPDLEPGWEALFLSIGM
jgi:hypothetical protein